MNEHGRVVAEWEWVIWLMSWGTPAQVTVEYALLTDERLTERQRLVLVELVRLLRPSATNA